MSFLFRYEIEFRTFQHPFHRELGGQVKLLTKKWESPCHFIRLFVSVEVFTVYFSMLVISFYSRGDFLHLFAHGLSMFFLGMLGISLCDFCIRWSGNCSGLLRSSHEKNGEPSNLIGKFFGESC